MSTEAVEEGVTLVRGDGKVVGLRLEDPRSVLRLPELIERLGLDEERVWSRLRGDVDVVPAPGRRPGAAAGPSCGRARAPRPPRPAPAAARAARRRSRAPRGAGPRRAPRGRR